MRRSMGLVDRTLTGSLVPSEASPPASSAPRVALGGSVPDAFDGYVLKCLLGRGGMGEVYLAQDTVLDRAVAVKFVAGLRGGPGARKRFLREARAIARLQ